MSKKQKPSWLIAIPVIFLGVATGYSNFKPLVEKGANYQILKQQLKNIGVEENPRTEREARELLIKYKDELALANLKQKKEDMAKSNNENVQESL
mmetsp:Transcript_13878/g.21002  ORF Transcript_13878/g.21002 Transcript_13878/m.21002 type:complete len:95 (+) Transcript_13878:10-294(+)